MKRFRKRIETKELEGNSIWLNEKDVPGKHSRNDKSMAYSIKFYTTLNNFSIPL